MFPYQILSAPFSISVQSYEISIYVSLIPLPILVQVSTFLLFKPHLPLLSLLYNFIRVFKVRVLVLSCLLCIMIDGGLYYLKPIIFVSLRVC